MNLWREEQLRDFWCHVCRIEFFSRRASCQIQAIEAGWKAQEIPQRKKDRV